MTSSSKLDQLTGLRYFAALLVFLSHLKWNETNDVLVKIFDSGYVGVSFFFLLSGFVLSYSYGEKISSRTLGFVKYAFLRLARLTPLHFLTAAPFVLFAIYKSDFNFLKTIINLSYLQSWVPNSIYYFSLNAPSWSLSNEMFFYVCFFPLVFLSTKSLLKSCLVLLGAIVSSAAFVEYQIPDQKFFGGNTFSHWLFYIFPGFRLLEFIVGMLLYKAWRTNFRISQWLILPSYILLFCSMYFAKTIPEVFRFSLYFLPFIAVFFYAHLTEDSFVYRAFSNKFIVLLGNASFAFYLIHQPLIGILKKITLSLNLTNFVFFVFSLITISLLSIVTYVAYERKSELFLKNLIARKFT